ncbi:hypothetical protein J6590_049151, partial [Homalodisca vitripennis]
IVGQLLYKCNVLRWVGERGGVYASLGPVGGCLPSCHETETQLTAPRPSSARNNPNY